jgi:quercetin dioxygenase-like cupin family protein
MAIPHLKSGEQMELALGKALPEAKTTTLLKTKDMEVIRLVLPAGKELPIHQAPSEITVQCLEGKVLFTAHGQECELAAGKFLYLSAAEPHSLKAVEDSSLLLTIVLGK